MNKSLKFFLLFVIAFICQTLKTDAKSDCKTSNTKECINQHLKIKRNQNNQNEFDEPFWEKPFDLNEKTSDDDENEDDYEFENIFDEIKKEGKEYYENGDEEEEDATSLLKNFYLQAKEDRETYQRLESQRVSVKINKLFQRIMEYFGNKMLK